jgi:hypothetical protein
MFGKKPASQPESAKPAPAEIPHTLETLLVWSAPSRLFRKRNKEYFTTILAIAFLFITILVVMREWLLILVIVALVFVNYVMGSVAPERVEHKLTNRGLETGDKKYPWAKLARFWLETKWDQKVLYVDTKLKFPRRLVLLLGETSEQKIKEIMLQYLPLDEPEPTWMDNASRWLSQKIPLEKPTA